MMVRLRTSLLCVCLVLSGVRETDAQAREGPSRMIVRDSVQVIRRLRVPTSADGVPLSPILAQPFRDGSVALLSLTPPALALMSATGEVEWVNSLEAGHSSASLTVRGEQLWVLTQRDHRVFSANGSLREVIPVTLTGPRSPIGVTRDGQSIWWRALPSSATSEPRLQRDSVEIVAIDPVSGATFPLLTTVGDDYVAVRVGGQTLRVGLPFGERLLFAVSGDAVETFHTGLSAGWRLSPQGEPRRWQAALDAVASSTAEVDRWIRDVSAGLPAQSRPSLTQLQDSLQLIRVVADRLIVAREGERWLRRPPAAPTAPSRWYRFGDGRDPLSCLELAPYVSLRTVVGDTLLAIDARAREVLILHRVSNLMAGNCSR